MEERRRALPDRYSNFAEITRAFKIDRLAFPETDERVSPERPGYSDSSHDEEDGSDRNQDLLYRD